jgi:hypothetical protein
LRADLPYLAALLVLPILALVALRLAGWLIVLAVPPEDSE